MAIVCRYSPSPSRNQAEKRFVQHRKPVVMYEDSGKGINGYFIQKAITEVLFLHCSVYQRNSLSNVMIYT